MSKEELRFRPHARLLTMLGDQLIKSDQIALVELVKNSFDADASKVWVDFQNFGPGFEMNHDSAIVITDNGSGMTASVLRDAWMSPATPVKLRRKQRDPITPGGRTIQGEKGIGRFAVFKLGSQLQLITRPAIEHENEVVLNLDLSLLDNDEGSSDAGETYLEDVRADLTMRKPEVFSADPPGGHGTQIVVSGVRSRWDEDKVQRAFADLERLQPLMWSEEELADTPSDFQVRFLKDGVDLRLHDGRIAHFQALFERAVLKVTDGAVDTAERMIRFNLNGRGVQLSLDGPDIRALRPFRERFLKRDPDSTPDFSCGPFSFGFYIFDFTKTAPAEHQLDKEDVALLRSHRVYLYRDGVRVYPYGDPDDDWLQIDTTRGTQSARSVFSNDQTVGYVSISQAGNPLLRDKTNREGLLEYGAATGDFIALIQTVLAYLRTKPYARYADANRRAREQNRPPREVADEQFRKLHSSALTNDVKRVVAKLESSVTTEREVAQAQLERTQDLAGVGLSVESASHDLIAASTEALRLARMVLQELRQADMAGDHVFTLAASLVQRLEFVDSRFQDVQGLFVSTRQKRGVVDVLQQARKVRSMYAALHKAKHINFDLDEASPLKVKTTEAAVLQTLINLVDNATYWLATGPRDPRTIRLFVHGENTLVVTDDGPGVAIADEPFIFEPFYSGKGDAGKGLGLYIAREVSLRNGFAIDLGSPTDSRVLPGATFKIQFSEVVS